MHSVKGCVCCNYSFEKVSDSQLAVGNVVSVKFFTLTVECVDRHNGVTLVSKVGDQARGVPIQWGSVPHSKK